MLAVKNLTKRYKDLTVLENVDLELENGVYGFLAPNGAGKTTFLKMLVTLSFPTEGEILWNGTDIRQLGASYRELLGYLPQNFGYYPSYSPRQYLMYLAALKGIDGKSAKRKIEELLELVGLSEVAGKKMRKFSGGMIQRVGIAQALLNDPRILILDEPTAGLDPKERVRFRNILSGLSRDKLVLLSTHIVSDVESVANRILLLKDRKLLCDPVPSLCGQLEGKVFEIALPENGAEAFEKAQCILEKRQEGDVTLFRFLADRAPPGAKPAAPKLEDVFMRTYG